MSMDGVEITEANGVTLCYIVRSSLAPRETTFVTPPEFKQRVGFVATREITAGDVVLLIGGGHGFRMLENTLFLELKQGPYLGVDEKVRFGPRP